MEIKMKKRLVIGMSGASGAPLTIELLKQLKRYQDRIETHLITVLSYYNHPKTIEDCNRYIVGKILDQFDLEGQEFHRWME